MSAPGASKLQTLVLTGNPTVDAVIRYGLVALCAGLTGAITGWLNAHGFNDHNLTVYVGMAVASILGGGALALWGIIRSSKNEALVRLREAIAVQAGINAAESDIPTPTIKTVGDAQQVIAAHAPAVAPTKN